MRLTRSQNTSIALVIALVAIATWMWLYADAPGRPSGDTLAEQPPEGGGAPSPLKTRGDEKIPDAPKPPPGEPVAKDGGGQTPPRVPEKQKPEPGFDGVRYDVSEHHVRGRVAGISNAKDYRVILMISVGGRFYVKPTLDECLSPIRDDGSFRIKAYSDYPLDAMLADKAADGYAVFLVGADFSGLPDMSDYSYIDARALDVRTGATGNAGAVGE
ncbi:MAG: hypothetical protein LBT74_05850 [Acidobacteriota bacterium]|jgi:hypothetical protein|nr:hypothetical protein [Acidobacteriota bacterium]